VLALQLALNVELAPYPVSIEITFMSTGAPLPPAASFAAAADANDRDRATTAIIMLHSLIKGQFEKGLLYKKANKKSQQKTCQQSIETEALLQTGKAFMRLLPL